MEQEAGNKRFDEVTLKTIGLISRYSQRKNENRNFDPSQEEENWTVLAGNYPEYGQILELKHVLDKASRSRAFAILSVAWHLDPDAQDNTLPEIIGRKVNEFLFFSIIANRIGMLDQGKELSAEETARGFHSESSQAIRELGILYRPGTEITAEMVIKSALKGELRLSPIFGA